MQQAFIDHDAFQCGYCTPGQIGVGGRLRPGWTRRVATDIQEFTNGNLCCAACPNIIAAAEDARDAIKDNR